MALVTCREACSGMNRTIRKFLPHLAALVTMFFWGLSYLSTRILIQEIPPTLAVFYRFTLASVFLWLLLLLRRKKIRILKEDIVKILLAGLTGVALNFTLENIGVKYTSTANVALLVATIPAMTLLFENYRLARKTGWKEMAGILVSMTGIVLITLGDKSSQFTFSLFGDAMVLLSSVAWAVYTSLVADLKGDYDSMEITLYTNFSGAVFMLPTLGFTGIRIPKGDALLHLIYLVLFCSILAYVLYMWALKRLGGVRLNSYINLQPIVAIFASIFLLKETMTPIRLIGSVIIIAGVWIVNRALRDITVPAQ